MAMIACCSLTSLHDRPAYRNGPAVTLTLLAWLASMSRRADSADTSTGNPDLSVTHRLSDKHSNQVSPAHQRPISHHSAYSPDVVGTSAPYASAYVTDDLKVSPNEPMNLKFHRKFDVPPNIAKVTYTISINKKKDYLNKKCSPVIGHIYIVQNSWPLYYISTLPKYTPDYIFQRKQNMKIVQDFRVGDSPLNFTEWMPTFGVKTSFMMSAGLRSTPDTLSKLSDGYEKCQHELETKMLYQEIQEEIPFLSSHELINISSNSPIIRRLRIMSETTLMKFHYTSCPANAILSSRITKAEGNCSLTSFLFSAYNNNTVKFNCSVDEIEAGMCLHRERSPDLASDYVMKIHSECDVCVVLHVVSKESWHRCVVLPFIKESERYIEDYRFKEDEGTSVFTSTNNITKIAYPKKNLAYIYKISLLASERGKTLKLKVVFNKDINSEDNFNVKGLHMCVSYNRICYDDDDLDPEVTSKDRQNSLGGDGAMYRSVAIGQAVSYYIPYAEPGNWYISIKKICFPKSNGSSQENSNSCPPSSTVKTWQFTAYLQGCIHGKCQIKNKYVGSCETLRIRDYEPISFCECSGGLSGYNCLDGRARTSTIYQACNTFLLTLSNMMFLFSMSMAIYRHCYTEAVIYIFNLLASTFYHACDIKLETSHHLCIFDYELLIYSDYFTTMMSLLATMCSVSRINSDLRYCVFVCMSVITAYNVRWNHADIMTLIVSLNVGLVMLMMSWGSYMVKHRKLYPSLAIYKTRLVPGCCMALFGMCLFFFSIEGIYYVFIHSIWHVVIASSCCFFLPGRKSQFDIDITNNNFDDELDTSKYLKMFQRVPRLVFTYSEPLADAGSDFGHGSTKKPDSGVRQPRTRDFNLASINESSLLTVVPSYSTPLPRQPNSGKYSANPEYSTNYDSYTKLQAASSEVNHNKPTTAASPASDPTTGSAPITGSAASSMPASPLQYHSNESSVHSIANKPANQTANSSLISMQRRNRKIQKQLTSINYSKLRPSELDLLKKHT